MIMKPKFSLLPRKPNGHKSHHATSPRNEALTNDNSSGNNSVSTWASASSPSSASSTSSLLLPSKKKSSFRFPKRRSKRLDVATSVTAADVRSSSSTTRTTTSSTSTTTSQSPSPSPSPSPILPPTKALLTPSERHHLLLRGTSCNAPFVPLSRHFDTQNHLLSLFDALYFYDNNVANSHSSAREGQGYSIAYAVGLRYVEMALFRLPRHGYYRSDGVREERRESLGQAARVARLLRDGLEEEEEDSGAMTSDTATATTTTKTKKETLRQWEDLARRSLEQETKEETSSIFCGGGSRSKSNREEKEPSSWREYLVDGSENICNLLALGCAGGVECVQDVCGGGKDSTDDPYENYHQEEKKLEMEDFNGDEMSSQHHVDFNKEEETLVTPEPLVVSSFASDTAVAEENVSQQSKAENESIHKQISLQEDSTQSSEDVADRYASVSQSRVSENQHQPQPQHQQQQLLGADPTASDEPPSINTESLVTAMEDEAEEAELLISRHSTENYDDDTRFHDDDLNLAIGLSMSMNMNVSTSTSMNMNVSVSGNSIADPSPSPSNDPSNDDSDNAVVASRSFQSTSHPQEPNDDTGMTLYGSASSGSVFASLTPSSTPVAVATPSPTSSVAPTSIPTPTPTMTPKDDIRSMTQRYRQRYQTLLAERKFHYRFLQTYQGRNPESTNGCTVIAPLTCIHYFIQSEDDDRDTTAMYLSSSSSPTRHPRHDTPYINHHDDGNDLYYNPAWEHGLHDEMIHHVIDEHAPAVLPIVRGKLGLAKDSFIIPSDVHEHLMEEGLLTTSQFVGVCGGNILDDDHIAQFQSTLLIRDPHERKRLRGKKIAAAFFFHGHVIALHVLRKSGNGRPHRRYNHPKNKCKIGEFDPSDLTIELIDSLPDPSTWIAPDSGAASDGEEREPVQERVSRGGTAIDGYDNNYDDDDDEEWERPEQFDDDVNLNQNAIRVRCIDVEHFDTLLRHYACSKFSGEEWKFIRENEWEDNNSYFDPRVFQAFVWAEA